MSQTPRWFRPFSDRISWLEFNQNIQIDLVHRYVYFEVAKAACSTVKRRLNPVVAQGLADPKVVHPGVYQSPFVKPFQVPGHMMRRILEGDGFLRFSFLREPTERFVSGFLDKIARPSPQRERFVARYMPDSAADAEISIEFFLSNLEQEDSKKAWDKHWRPQCDLLFQPDQAFDFLGTTAHFERDWSALLGLMKDVDETSRENIVWHATSAASKVDEVLNAQQKARVQKLFADDYALYDRVCLENAA